MKVMENKQLHHLGIVAGVCNEIGLIEVIDRHMIVRGGEILMDCPPIPSAAF